jgi:hypothetical protein
MLADNTLDNGYGSGLALSSEDAANLRKAGKWGRFLGIVSMIFLGLGIVAFLGFGSTMIAMMMGGDAGMAGGAMTGMIVFYVAMFAFSFYLVYLLYKFGAEAVTAVDQGDNQAMTRSFASLGRMLKIYGIIMVIYFGFLALGLLIAVIGGGMAFLGS